MIKKQRVTRFIHNSIDDSKHFELLGGLRNFTLHSIFPDKVLIDCIENIEGVLIHNQFLVTVEEINENNYPEYRDKLLELKRNHKVERLTKEEINEFVKRDKYN